MQSPASNYAIDKLVEMGVLSEEALERLGMLFKSLETISSASSGMRDTLVVGGFARRKPGRKPGPRPAGGGKPGRKPRVEITKAQLKEMLASGMKGKEIAEKLGVSVPTIHLKKAEFGLTKKRKGGKKPGPKKTGKKKTSKKTAKKSKNGRRKKTKKGKK